MKVKNIMLISAIVATTLMGCNNNGKAHEGQQPD